MVDTLTLRVAFSVIAICVFVLFYTVTYRTARSPYSGWWCLSLALFILSTVLYLGHGTAAQGILNPIGNALAVAGGCCAWVAARSLREQVIPAWPLVAVPAPVLVASLLDDPQHDAWAGGAFFLAGMSVGFALCSRELVLLRRARSSEARTQAPSHFRNRRTAGNIEHRRAVTSLAVMSGIVAGYYLVRMLVLLGFGSTHAVFVIGVGEEVTTLLTMAMLVVVTFSMSALSHEQQTRGLRTQATQDSLTGVLNRAEFFRLAEAQFAATDHQPHRGAVMVADLDDFKSLNDGHGHAAGDWALTEFAAACQRVAGADGLVGRLGGDEFVIVLHDGRQAERIAGEISRHLRNGPADHPRATVSFGIASIDPSISVKDMIIRADVALYRAKAAGRDRIVWYDDPVAPVPEV